MHSCSFAYEIQNGETIFDKFGKDLSELSVNKSNPWFMEGLEVIYASYKQNKIDLKVVTYITGN